MDSVIFTSGGIGDQILGLQCAFAAKRQRPELDIEVIACARDEVYGPLKYLFHDAGILITQHKDKELWGQNNWIVHNQDALKEYPHPNKYYVTPDLLFRGPLAFDYTRFNLDINVIREMRCLTWKRRKTKKLIYLGLNTSTPEYKYPHIRELIYWLSVALPDHTIYFNDLDNWAGHTLDNNALGEYNDNVRYVRNEDFYNSLDILMESRYVVCLDNGISHISYQLGIPRLLLSKRLDSRGLMWLARWYPTLSDCLPYDVSPLNIAHLVKTNVETPQTTLVPRNVVVGHHMANWAQALGFKY